METAQNNAHHVRALMTLGLPLIGSHLAQVAIGVTDTLMMGWYDVTELAAVVLATSYFFSLFLMGSGFALAVSPMVAAASAQDDLVQARRTTRMGVWLTLAFAGFCLPLLIWSGPLLLLLGQTPEISELAQQYLRIAAWGLVPALLVMVLKSFLTALERTQVVFWVTVFAALANAGLNYVLIFGKFGAPEMGLRGAAIASVSLHVLSFVFLLFYIRRVLPEYALFQRLWRPDTQALREVYRLGWPISLTLLAEVGLFAASAIMVGWIGTVELAAHGIALQIASLTFMVHLGLSQATTVRTGKFFGARDWPAMRRGGLVGTAMSIGFALLTIIVFLAIPEILLGVFIDPDEPQRAAILAVGVSLMAMAALFQLADGAQVMALGLLRGVQDTRVPMVVAAISYWVVGMPVSYVVGFVFGFGAAGVWFGLVAGLALAGLLFMVRFWGRTLPQLEQVQ